MPFYYPEQDSLQTSSGPLVIGSGLTVDYETGTLLATPGGLPTGVEAVLAGNGIFVNGNTGVVSISNTGVLDIQSGSNIAITRVGGTVTIQALIPPQLNGTVTCIRTGPGLTGGPIVSTGTICLQPTGVTEGSYTNANISVDSYGRVLSASCGSFGQTFIACSPLSITGTGPVVFDICSATESQRGVVLLCNSTQSTSQLTAATPSAVFSVCTIAANASLCAVQAVSLANSALIDAQAAEANATTALAQSAQALTDVVTAQNTADTALADALNAQNTANDAESLATSAEVLANTALTTAATAVPLACYTQKGTVLSGTGTGLVSGVTPVSDGQVLVSCALCSQGVHWVDPSGTIGTVTQVNAGGGLAGGPITSVGTLYVSDTGVVPNTYANATITVNSRGQITSATDGSTTAGIPCGIITRNGELIVGAGPNQPVALPPGNTGQILVADPSQPTGVLWASYGNNWYVGTQSFCAITAYSFDTPAVDPSIGVWAHNCLMWRALGGKMWEVRGSVCVTNPAGFTEGNGSYAFPLPAGLCFNTTPGLGQPNNLIVCLCRACDYTIVDKLRCSVALPNTFVSAVRRFCGESGGCQQNTWGSVYIPSVAGQCSQTGIPCACYTLLLNDAASSLCCGVRASDTIGSGWYNFTKSNCIRWNFTFLAA
jgi:hypothetical protein